MLIFKGSFLMISESEESESVNHFLRLFATSWTYPARLLCPWNSLDNNTGMGCHSLLQGIFPTQGSNLHLLHYIYFLSHQGSCVSYLFPSVTSGFSGWVVETRGMATSWAASPSPSCSSGRASSSAESANFFLLLWCNPPSIRFPKLPVEPVARGEGPDVSK